MKRGSIKKHPLVETLIRTKGNPKTLIFLEPLWGIPFNLIAPLTTLFMVSQGITDVQIGLLLTVGFVFQVVLSVAGGIVTDKIGRRATTILGDFFGWSAACMVWAVSGNFWFFLVAAILNCFEQLNQAGWVCLLVEDADPKDLTHIYTWISIGGLVAVFFAPISGLLIERFTLVPVARSIYVLFAVTMLLKSIITWRFCTETSVGVERQRLMRGKSVRSLLADYFRMCGRQLRDRTSRGLLLIILLLSIANMVANSFSTLYMNRTLGIPEQYITYLPIFNALVQLVFLFALQHLLDRLRIKVPILLGVVMLIACQLVLIFSPPQSMGHLILYTALNSFANAMVYPRREAMLARNVDPKDRARSMSFFGAANLLLTAPFGYLVGWMSSVNRSLPFVFAIGVYIVLFVTVVFFRERAAHAEAAPENA